MLDEVSVFWNSLSGDMKNFIIGTASKLTADFLISLGIKKTDDIQVPMGEAYKEGIKHSIKTMNDSRIDLDHIRNLLGNEEIKSLLINIVKDESFAKNTVRIENIFEQAGIDIKTIEGFSVNAFIESFLTGFMSKAELSEKLIPFLELQKLKELVKILKGEKPDLVNLKRRYFNYLKEKYSWLSFKGLSEGKMLSLPMDRLYTRLAFAEDLPISGEEYLKVREDMGRVEFIRHTKQKESITLADILKSQYSVITGDPGAGKSTLLKYIALSFVDAKQGERLGLEENLMPIIFPVAAYAEASKKASSINYSLKRFIPDYFMGKELPDLTPLFTKAIKENKALFLIDGLDEVADETERKKMVEDIRNFVINDGNLGNRFIITCRIASYTKTSRFESIGGKEFSHYTVLPFDIGHIKEFLFNWYCCYEKEIYKRFITFEAEARIKRDKMVSIIENDKNIFSIATNPLMLTILALIEHEGGELPRNRADLYGKCLRMFAGLWEKLRSLHEREKPEFRLGGRMITEDFIIDFLGPIAYEMHEKALPDIEYEEIKDRLALKFEKRNKDMLLSKQQAEDLITILKEQSGIIQEVSPRTYGFIHPTFKEYLTARVLADLSEDRLKQLEENLFKPEWQEVVLLTASSLKKRDATNFIGSISEKNTNHFENLILAGKCLMNTGRDKIDDELFDGIIKEMRNVLEGDYLIDDKVSVGETLGWLGDPRDLKEFVSVKSGEYKLFTGRVSIQAFGIGKYPVTNGWFEEFVTTGGYSDQSYWSEEGKEWLRQSGNEYPRYWNERKWKCPNSPVVGICWYEAKAFTNWLTSTDKDGYQYRIPNENEWEAAATGFKGREYPWGNQWDKNKCNTYEGGIGKNSPVGIFNKGNTPEGISDLAGNVWEWTESWYDEEKKIKVLRGGSWGFFQNNARCAERYWNYPDNRDGNVGFRCARTITL